MQLLARGTPKSGQRPLGLEGREQAPDGETVFLGENGGYVARWALRRRYEAAQNGPGHDVRAWALEPRRSAMA